MPAPAPISPVVEGRLFLAVDLAADVRRDLASRLAASPLACPLPGRPVAPESWHLTLRFLGQTPAPDGARLVAGLHAAALGAPFDIAFGRLGAFPRAARAQVLWLGLEEGVDALRRLAGVVERAVVAAGFPAEHRPFDAHLTLSRLRPAEDLRGLIGALSGTGLRQRVDAVALFRSHLGRDGARYEPLAHFPLASSSAQPVFMPASRRGSIYHP